MTKETTGSGAATRTSPRRRPPGGDRGAPTPRDDLDAALALIDELEARAPEPYRRELLRALLPGRLPPASATAVHRGSPGAASRPRHLELQVYASVLTLPGKTLLKALVALEVGAAQLELAWMTPAEIERFLTERARVRSIYRTNVSNALRSNPQYADRRRRGRAYEYRITNRGREALRRGLLMLG